MISLSFSPVYCAPEWAKFLVDDSDEPRITIDPALDVWSIGMTACELVSLDAVLKPKYISFGKIARSRRDQGVLYFNWLRKVKKPPLPEPIQQFDDEFADLMSTCLLVGSPKNRKPLAQALNHPCLSQPFVGKTSSSPLTCDD
jgi:serine/threonine protein kinase